MDASPLEQALDDLPLATLSESGEAPPERLKDAKSLQDIFKRMRSDDRVNAYNRALAQGLLDGEPPYDQTELDDSGQPNTTNLNFHGAQQRLERAKSPYYKLIHGTDTMLTVKTRYGAEDERPYWESVIAEEISRMIRRWRKFPYETELLVLKHVWDAVGLVHWSDDLDWRFSAGGLGQFYFPRMANATEVDQTIVCRYDEYSVTDLYRKVADKKRAKAAGWNVKATLEAIRSATSTDSEWQDWEKLMMEVKNNDLSTGTRAPKIKVIHGLVEEFGGKVSHYIATEDAQKNQNFLYKSRDEFENMTEALVLFPYSVGTNAKLHGIRGLGYACYAFEQQRNRSLGRLIDKGFEASATMIQAIDETSLLNSGLEYYGNLAVLQPGFSIVERTQMDLQRSVMPALEMMDRLVAERTAGYSSENVFDGDQRKTKAEVMAHLDQSAALQDSSLDFFYGPWRKVLQQIIKRISRKGYHRKDPGGEYVHKLKQHLEERGVPLEALYKLDHEETAEIRVIGAGSAAAKTIALQRMGEMYGRMDDVGKMNYDRDVSVDIVGASNANRYFPSEPMVRTTVDTHIAILQNEHLLNGVEVPVLGTDKHLAHAREHLKPLMEMYQAAEGGQIDLAQAATTAILLYEHTVKHVDMIDGDETSVDEAMQMRQMLQRIGEIISNGLKEAEAQAQEAQEEGEQQAQGPSVEQTERFAKAQAEIAIMQQKAATDQQIKLENAQLDRGIKLANASADIRLKTAVTKAQPKKK
jgi:hypothetical protein